MNLKENTTLQSGKYRIIRVLGQGGFGITYLAENVFFNKIVAIKEFFPKSFCGRDNTSHLTLGTANNAETVEKLLNRFMKEARNIAKLDHPGIVKIQDIFKENNTAYYVMDYIEGENLNEIVKRNGSLSEEKAVEYIKKVGEALSYIHSKNMTHFDVKPANIMIRRSDDMPILIDFGLSKQYDGSGDATSTMLNAISQGYSPIELYNPGTLNSFSPQTDVYSLAATLLFLLTGKTPHSASDIATDGLSLPDSISQDMKETIQSAMQIRKNTRTQDIENFVDNLRFAEIISQQTRQPDPSPTTEETQFINPSLPIDEDDQYEHPSTFAKYWKHILILLFVFVILCIVGYVVFYDDYFISDEACISKADAIMDKEELTQEDASKALKYLIKPAEHGIEKAQEVLGFCFMILDKPREAVFWWEKAAAQGSPTAQFNVARAYEEGEGVTQSFAKAAEWYKKSAEQGDADAQTKIAYLYATGNGVPQSEDNAVKWWEKAAFQNNSTSQFNLGVYYLFHQNNVSKGIEWIKKAAENDNDVAQGVLGDFYFYGDYLEKSISEAFKWYQKSAEQGNSHSQTQLGICYQHGLGVQQSLTKANAWFLKAASQGDSIAIAQLDSIAY